MAKRSYSIERFGGIRLDLAPDEVGANEAIDGLNVDFDRRGSVRTRDGYSKFNAVSAGVGVSLQSVSIWFGQFLGSSATNLYVYDDTGVLVTSTAISNAVTGTVSLGTASAGPYLYIATGGAAIKRWNRTAFSTMGAGFPAARFLGIQPTDNRLVAANVSTLPSGSSAASASSSLVYFSDPGAPETWSASSWAYLHPNDGDVITALVTWRAAVFVFKTKKFFVFYGNSTDSDGNAEFNERCVDTGLGAASGVACAAEDGVYFATFSGVYRTTGDDPVKVSGAIDPLFQGGSSTFFTPASVGYVAPTAISAVAGRVYVSVNLYSITSTISTAVLIGYYTLVYDSGSETWSVWHFAAATVPPRFAALSTALGLSYMVAGTSHIYLVRGATNDDGTAITSRYRSGFYSPLDNPSQECKVRESIIDGTGTPTFSVSRDFAASLPTTAGGAKTTVTLGTAPAVAQGRHMKSQVGRRFSYQIEGTTPWLVNSITQQIEGFREPGRKTD